MNISSDESLAMPLRLVVGLGNPGRQYEGTRHNIGFDVVDALAKEYHVAFSFSAKWNADIARVSQENGEDFWLMKPRTLMNLSGTAVAAFSHFFKIAPTEVLVVSDEVMLPVGALRLRRSGSAGGQRGLASVLVHFSTESVPRLRLGVGAPIEEGLSENPKKKEAMTLSEYVLSRFEAAELVLAGQAIQRAVEAVQTILKQDFGAAMNKFNEIKNKNFP